MQNFITLQASDSGKTISIDCRNDVYIITLPAPSLGFNITIKDTFGNAHVNNITVIRASVSHQIDNEVNDDIIDKQFGSISYISDGVKFYRVANVFAPNIKGLFGAGYNGTDLSTVEYANIATKQNALLFGSLANARTYPAALGSETRTVFGGGAIIPSTTINSMQFFTTATLSGSSAFGNLTVGRWGVAGLSNSTRGLFAGGNTGASNNTIDYITIATASNAIDFGDVSGNRYGMAAGASPTRGMISGGYNVSYVNNIEYVTIATTGNSLSFGNLASAVWYPAGASNATKYITGGGGNASPNVNLLQMVFISNLSASINFGNLSVSRWAPGACATQSRGLWVAGDSGTYSSIIDFVTLASESSAAEFGGLITGRNGLAGTSNGHGGLSV